MDDVNLVTPFYLGLVQANGYYSDGFCTGPWMANCPGCGMNGRRGWIRG